MDFRRRAQESAQRKRDYFERHSKLDEKKVSGYGGDWLTCSLQIQQRDLLSYLDRRNCFVTLSMSRQLKVGISCNLLPTVLDPEFQSILEDPNIGKKQKRERTNSDNRHRKTEQEEDEELLNDERGVANSVRFLEKVLALSRAERCEIIKCKV